MDTQPIKLISLYEYLGYQSTYELRQEVYKIALKLGESTYSKQSHNTRYKKITHYFRREFLDEYFKIKKIG